MLNTSKKLGGFTLIETLIYISVLVIVVGTLITTFLSFDIVLIRNRTERVLASEARASFEHIMHSIKQSDAVNTGVSVFDTSPGVLALSGTTTRRFYVTNGVLIAEQGGIELGPLTSDAVTIEDLRFNHQSGSSTTLIRMSLTLSANNKAASTTRTFYSSAVLRGSYE